MRMLLHGGSVLDARGGSVSAAHVTVEDGRIVDVADGIAAGAGRTLWVTGTGNDTITRVTLPPAG